MYLLKTIWWKKDLSPPQGKPTNNSSARPLPNSPRSASSCFSICTIIVQTVFPPDRTVNHKLPADPFHFREPLSKSVEKTYTPREHSMGACTKALHGRSKIIRRAKNIFVFIRFCCFEVIKHGATVRHYALAPRPVFKRSGRPEQLSVMK
jgi:hypothetical protein